MFKGVCLDLFHTLVDVAQVPTEVGRFTADILGLEREAWNDACFSAAHEITRQTDHYTSIRLMAHSLNPEIPEHLLHEAVLERQQRFDYALHHVDAEVLETLSTLRSMGIKLALISNASTSEVAAWAHSPLAEYFHSAVFSCDIGLRKPDTGIYLHALDAIQLKAQDCLFVGDGGSDEHLGARAVGLTPVLITRHIHQENKLRTQRSRVEHEIRHLPELLTLLTRRI